MRDATPYEIFEEPDGVLQGLADGSIEATWFTRQAAETELEYRAAEREKASA